MRENPFMSFNHIKIGVVESDHAEVWLDIQPESTNIYGVVHGGALFTMADCCAGLTARSDGREYVTQNACLWKGHQPWASCLYCGCGNPHRREYIDFS